MFGRSVALIVMALPCVAAAASTAQAAAGAFVEVIGGSSQVPGRWASEGHDMDFDPGARPSFAFAEAKGAGVGGSWLAFAEGGDNGHGRISLRVLASTSATAALPTTDETPNNMAAAEVVASAHAYWSDTIKMHLPDGFLPDEPLYFYFRAKVHGYNTLNSVSFVSIQLDDQYVSGTYVGEKRQVNPEDVFPENPDTNRERHGDWKGSQKWVPRRPNVSRRESEARYFYVSSRLE